jgi:hypothetical protein
MALMAVLAEAVVTLLGVRGVLAVLVRLGKVITEALEYLALLLTQVAVAVALVALVVHLMRGAGVMVVLAWLTQSQVQPLDNLLVVPIIWQGVAEVVTMLVLPQVDMGEAQVLRQRQEQQTQAVAAVAVQILEQTLGQVMAEMVALES